MFRREASWNFVSWSISAEWFAVLFLFSLCARVLSRLSRVTFGVIVLVCWLTLCVYCFPYNDGDVGLTTFGVLRIVLQAWRDIWDDLPDEMALPVCDAKLPTEAGEPANRDNWQTAAQRIADEFFERDTANGCRDSPAGYSQRVVEEMKERWRCFNAYLRTNWPLRSAMPMRRFRQISYVGRICVH
ncbi:hypothetical protein [Paraburkholderia sp. MM6662-R1]|uniref:hypothetical protein n=1 Tax=Paraburkholderia sp. MM6662-R1 TaxID=2991066 RepID=UPI003D1D8C4F